MSQTLNQFAVLDQQDPPRVLRLHPTEELGAVELPEPVEGMPPRPHEGAELIWLAGALAWLDTRALDQVRAACWARIKAERERRDQLPIAAAGVELDGDDKSRMNLLGAIMDMQLTGATSRWWVCADNVRRELTAAQIREVGLALAARTQALVDAADALRAQVFDPAHSEAAQIEAVNWPPDAAAIP